MSSRLHRLATPAYYAGVFVLTLLALTVATRAYENRWDVPIKSYSDILFNSMPMRAVQDGEPLSHITRLSAPFFYNQFLFWPGSIVAQGWACLIALFVSPVGSALLLAWFTKVAIGACWRRGACGSCG
jgi:hypothetical protein